MESIESAKMGNVKFFEEVGIDVIQNSRSENGDSVLALAAVYGNLECCKIIYKRCPQLLYITNKKEATSLHHAAWNGCNDIIEFLLNVEKPNKLLMMATLKMHTALYNAVRRGHPESARLLLQEDPSNNLLRMADRDGNTPMHLAVRNHNLEIVKLLLETDPTNVYGPNNFGHTPHLIALQESSPGDQTTVAIRKLLIEKQPDECKKAVGEKGWTLLHHATVEGDITCIEHILESCSECVEMVNANDQNFIHIAAKFEHEKLLRHILASLKVNDHVLNQQDIYGNTPLHIATSTGNANVILPLLYDSRVYKFAVNKQGNTALATIKFDYDKRRAGVYGLTNRVDEKDLKDRSDFDLLVGALISTVSFTAGITVPGGYYSDGPNRGNAILYKKISFEAFVLSNTIALALSLYAVFCHFCTRHLIDEDNIIYQLRTATYCSLGAIFSMMVAFITGSYAVLSVSDWLAMTVCLICCCFFGFASRAMWMMLREQRQRWPLFSRNVRGFLV